MQNNILKRVVVLQWVQFLPWDIARMGMHHQQPQVHLVIKDFFFSHQLFLSQITHRVLIKKETFKRCSSRASLLDVGVQEYEDWSGGINFTCFGSKEKNIFLPHSEFQRDRSFCEWVLMSMEWELVSIATNTHSPFHTFPNHQGRCNNSHFPSSLLIVHGSKPSFKVKECFTYNSLNLFFCTSYSWSVFLTLDVCKIVFQNTPIQGWSLTSSFLSF